LDSPLDHIHPDTDRDPGDIATRPRQARYNAGLERSEEASDYRNCRSHRLEIEDEVIANGNNHIRIAAHYIAGQIRIMHGTPFARISLNQDVFRLDVSQTMEFGEQRANTGGETRSVSVATGCEG